jgi:hypothetical protein
MIRGATQYKSADDICIISCFYNPNAYVTKPENFNRFIERIQASGLDYRIVECAFGKQAFSLKKDPRILRLRTTDIMWQKERLLNIALEHLPERCKKVVWLDCDVLFENTDWAVETSRMLEHYKVIQPFKQVIRLPKHTIDYKGSGECYWSFGFVFRNNPLLVSQGKFEDHGHTGFAWAAQKSILQKYKFYDVCIAGTADHIMAHSFVGDWDTHCVKRVFGNNPQFYDHYLKWSKKIYSSVRSKVSYVDGTLLHLWHGDVVNRKYAERERVLEKFNFNPSLDLRLNAKNCWKWNHSNRELKEWAKEYFVLRKED